MKPASHPSHSLWKSLRDSHIPTASTTGDICLLVPPQLERCCRKGLVTDVSGPQRNACPGTLSGFRRDTKFLLQVGPGLPGVSNRGEISFKLFHSDTE